MLSHTDLSHDLLGEGEGYVGAVALRVALGVGWRPMGRGPALSLAGTGLDEAALIPHGHTGLTGGTLGTAAFTVKTARFGTAPHLYRDQEHWSDAYILGALQ